MRLSRQILSYLMIAAGAFLLISGARDYFQSRLGQSDIAQDYGSEVPETPANPVARTLAARLQPVLGSPIGKLEIPRLGAQLFVVEGDGEQELRRGPGHLAGTALPGAQGNCVIAGHRDTHFRVLKDIHKGDIIHLQTRDGRYTYRVQTTRIVSPDDVSSLQPTADAQLHLVTCYPFYYIGPAPQRFVVEAELAKPPAPATITASAAGTPPKPAIIRHAARRPARPIATPTSYQAEIPSTIIPAKRKGHRKIFGWTRVLKSFTASKNSHPTSLQ